MNAKLTLTIDEATVEKAKKYASKKGRSLSGLIENYLKVITKEDADTESELTPIVKSLKGSFTVPEDLDYKKEIVKSLKKKYLK